MRRVLALALFVLVAAVPAYAGLVQVEVHGVVEYNQVRAPALMNRDVVHSGDPVTVKFLVDSTNYADSTNFPVRGYVVVPGSYSLTFDTSTGPLVIPFPSPYPNGGTPYFVVRNNDPHVDGFYFSTDNLDYPFTAFWVNDVARFAPYFQQAFEVSYPEDRLPSLDIYDATGTYNYDGLSVFYFSIIDGGFDAMFVDYTDMTISRVPVEVPVDFRPGGCPNPLNPTTVGVLPVAILGTGSLDVATIDPASIRLNGVPALRSSIEDVGAPFYPVNGKNDCSLDCEASDPDGIADLTLKFDTRAVAATLGDVGTGACVVLHLTGNFLGSTDDGGPIAGEDVAVVVGLGLGHRISGADRIRSGSPAFVVPQPTSPGTSLQLP